MTNNESFTEPTDIDALVEQGVLSYSDAAEVSSEGPSENALQFPDAAARLAVEVAVQAGDERPDMIDTVPDPYEPADQDGFWPDAYTWKPEDGNQKNGPHASAWLQANADPFQYKINTEGLAKVKAVLDDLKTPKPKGL